MLFTKIVAPSRIGGVILAAKEYPPKVFVASDSLAVGTASPKSSNTCADASPAERTTSFVNVAVPEKNCVFALVVQE